MATSTAPQSDTADPPENSTTSVDANPERGLPLDMLSLATFLYEDEAKTGPLLGIPAQFTDDE
jgi:hypothetical protein